MARFPRSFLSALMLLCVSIAGVTVSLADTVIKNPDGWTLEFGKSELEVNLNPSDRQAAGATGETPCILLGMINGRCAVADPSQTSGGNAATNQ
jgi:hypothetical protein